MVIKFMVVLGNGHTFITNDLCEEYQCGFPPPFATALTRANLPELCGLASQIA